MKYAWIVVCLLTCLGPLGQSASPLLTQQPQRPGVLKGEEGNREGPRANVDRQGDPLPDRALARLGSMRLRHGGAVYPDGSDQFAVRGVVDCIRRRSGRSASLWQAADLLRGTCAGGALPAEQISRIDENDLRNPVRRFFGSFSSRFTNSLGYLREPPQYGRSACPRPLSRPTNRCQRPRVSSSHFRRAQTRRRHRLSRRPADCGVAQGMDRNASGISTRIVVYRRLATFAQPSQSSSSVA